MFVLSILSKQPGRYPHSNMAQPAVLASIISIAMEKPPFGAAHCLMNSMRARRKAVH